MGETSLKSAYEEDDLEAEEDLADKIAQLIKDYSHFFVKYAKQGKGVRAFQFVGTRKGNSAFITGVNLTFEL